MSALETMMKAVLSSMDLDLEETKASVIARVKAFEANIETLNKTLIGLLEGQRRTEQKLHMIADHLGVSLPPMPSANEGKPNEPIAGRVVSEPARLAQNG